MVLCVHRRLHCELWETSWLVPMSRLKLYSTSAHFFTSQRCSLITSRRSTRYRRVCISVSAALVEIIYIVNLCDSACHTLNQLLHWFLTIGGQQMWTECELYSQHLHCSDGSPLLVLYMWVLTLGPLLRSVLLAHCHCDWWLNCLILQLLKCLLNTCVQCPWLST